MNEEKLKSDFHKLIDSFEDIDVLESLYEALNDLKNNDKDILDDLNSEQLKRLNKSMQQARKGDVIKHHIMREKIWTSEKQKI
jgi:hypothetical protein